MAETTDPKGNIVMETFEDGSGRTDALIFRPGAAQKYVVAHGYDAETGEWSQGSYFSDPMRAYAEANPEVLEESLVVWEKDDVRAALEDEGMAAEDIEDATRGILAEEGGMKGWRDWAVQEGNDIIRAAVRDAVEKPPASREAEAAAESPRAAEEKDGWHEKCEGFKADPETLKEWHRGVRAQIEAAGDWIPCWGAAYCMDNEGVCLPAAEFERILPTREEQELYFALQHVEGLGDGAGLGEGGGLTFKEVLACCENVAGDAEVYPELEALAEASGVGLVDLEPSEFEPEDLAKLASARPDLFDDESCAKWPELADAKKAAAFEATLDGGVKSSEIAEAEKRGPAKEEKSARRAERDEDDGAAAPKGGSRDEI